MLGLGNTLVKGVDDLITSVFGVPLSSNAYSIDFDGTNDYITMGDSNTFSFGDASTDLPFSGSAWVNMDDATKFRILSKSSSATPDNTIVEWFFGTSASDLLSLYLYDASTGIQIRRHTAALTSSQSSWLHVAFTYSGGGNNTDIHLYVDGENADDSVGVGGGGTYVAMHNTAAALEIGRLANTSSTTYSNGTIDEVSLWDRELTAGEVNAIYNSGLPTDLSDENGLIGYWRMDEGTGTSAADSSTNSNAGTLTNAPTWASDTPDD